MSRLDLAREAVRPALKARLLLAGVAGAGKTLSGLESAAVLAEGGPILLIDSEKNSALTYADWFEAQWGYKFTHLPWEAPFDPRELASVILEGGEQYAVVIVDSLSHFWGKSGGTLDIAEGRFSGWKVARPAQEDLLDAILSTKAHLIACVRSKIEYAQEQNQKTGKQEVTKLGLALQQDNTLEFEVNIFGQLDIEHRLAITKSRCIDLPVGRSFAPGHVRDMAEAYSAWLKGGEPPVALADVAALVASFDAIAEEADRRAAKIEFVKLFGRPEQVGQSRMDAARTWVAERVPGQADQTSSNGSPPEASSEAPLEPPAAPAAAEAEPQGAPRAGSPTRTVTEAQKLVLLFKELLPDYDDQARHDVYSAAVGRKVTSGNDLNARERAKVRSAAEGLASKALDLFYEPDGTPVLVAREAGAA